MIINGKTIRKIYCFLVATFPLLNRYTSIIPYVTLAEFLLFLFMIVSIVFFRHTTLTYVWPTIVITMYLLIIAASTFAFSNDNVFDLVGSTGRLAFLYFIVSFSSRDFGELKYLYRYIGNVGFIMAVYSLLQLLFSYVGIYLTSNIPFLKVMGINTNEKVLERAGYHLQYRPSAFFTEPSMLCIYLALALVVVLYNSELFAHLKLYAVVITIASVFSRSSTGLIVVAFIWGIYFIRYTQKSRTQAMRGLWIICAIVPVVAYIMYRFQIWTYFVGRVFGSNAGALQLSNSTRFRDLARAFETKPTMIQTFVGRGIREMTDYLPGFFRAYYCLGLIGLALFVWFMIWCLAKGDKTQRMITIVYALLNVGTEIIMGAFLIPFSVIMTNDKQKVSTKLYSETKI